jgi:hypothetical protein
MKRSFLYLIPLLNIALRLQPSIVTVHSSQVCCSNIVPIDLYGITSSCDGSPLGSQKKKKRIPQKIPLSLMLNNTHVPVPILDFQGLSNKHGAVVAVIVW